MYTDNEHTLLIRMLSYDKLKKLSEEGETVLPGLCSMKVQSLKFLDKVLLPPEKCLANSIPWPALGKNPSSLYWTAEEHCSF
jgi:hypothetical protein